MHSLEDAKHLKTGQTRIAGLDLGTKTIGIALSDLGWQIATPAFVIRRSKFTKDIEDLLAFAREQNVAVFVLGLPINMDGSEGPRAQSTRAFAKNLSKLTHIPILFQDERLSTVAAEKIMLQANLSRKKRAEKIDAAAAAYILQGALDQFNFKA